MSTTNRANKPIDPPAKDYESPDDEDDDEDTVVGTCLHCNCPPPPRSERCGQGTFTCTPCPASDPTAASTVSSSTNNATRVQVSCDDCRSFICDGCHWCHEFQANHEIRVCDRCDAFYCRACDEMDQCEDCSEVVCNTCSTLMSCKFCGCGLCEDCATACGRCGIVLCARDAKFAVECDTCKMSYCLVCLASGTKDPCVRCGQRPSKRVEQLVHLRLKSIYKAFKQSGVSGGGPGPPGMMDGGCNPPSDEVSKISGGGRETSSTHRGKYSSALRSLTESESLRSMEGSTSFDQSMASEVAAVLQTASNSMSSDQGDDGRRSRGRRVSSHPPPPFSTHDQVPHRQHTVTSPLWRKTREEIEAANAAAEASANAAAAALLAELDEEETSGPSKKSKKKKKKKDKKKESPDLAPEKLTVNDTVVEEPRNLDSKSNAASNKKQGTKAESKSFSIDDESSDEEEMILEQLVGINKASKPPKKERQKDDKEKPATTELPPSPAPPSEGTPELDKDLADLIANNDEDGLEDFLANLKGVPGLSILRKATKKALKKMKDDKAGPETKSQKLKDRAATSVQDTKPAKKPAAQNRTTPSAPAAQPSTNITPSSTAASQHLPLLRVVSRTQSSVGSTAKGGAVNTKPVSASARAECVMHMAPTVVGWVIGKGGQRIRDMMEESGAKIWIDQESMGDNDARVVYVSGKRSSVDTAVRMVKDLIAKAPVSASVASVPAQSAIQATTQAPPALSKSPSPDVTASSAPSSDPSPSFAAAAAAAKQPTSAAQAIPKTSIPNKSSASGWSNTDSTARGQLPKAAAFLSTSTPQTTVDVIDGSSKSIASLMSASKQTSDIIRKEIACDPQFIGLLLGRNSLAAKSIQAESGASLHINQTVAPGKIGISGRAENVAKAEQLIYGVLKYRDDQAQKASTNMDSLSSSTPISNMRPDGALVNESRMRSENVTTVPPMQLNNLQHQEDMQFHQRPSQIPNNSLVGDLMNFPPGYDDYQRGPSFLSSDGNLFQGQNIQRHSTQATMPTSPSTMADSSMPHQQQEWGQLPQSQVHLTNQYAASQFSSRQQISGNGSYMGSNPYVSSNNSSATQSTIHSTPSAFSSMGDQNLRYHHNVDASRQSSSAPLPQGHLNSIEGFLNQENNRQDMNGWGLNTNGATDNWSQSQIAPQAARGTLGPSFATQHGLPLDTTPSLSDDLFLNQKSPNNRRAPTSQSSGNPSIDDSQFVDNMFNSLGEPGKDGDGLLDSLNSMNLGGLQQGGTWGSSIGGWEGLLPPNKDDSNNIRRGGGFETNFGTYQR